MKCRKCQTENPEGKKFCRKCGERLFNVCPQCGSESLLEDEFCGECGKALEGNEETEKKGLETEGERKHVSVLFSDLSGYTAMSEKLDPEEVKAIMSRIFGEIAHVVTKYEGFVEKFAGDAVMALFGVPKAHEDDPIRAIRAAQEIHAMVEGMSPDMEERVGHSLSMHSGINTGLVVTGEVNLAKGTHRVSGDTINLASRLSVLAKTGEIVVGPDTYRQAEGYFAFETLGPTEIKGKEDPVPIYKVLTSKERPITIHRLSGLRADLIGRNAEITQLGEAVQSLRQGKGSVFSICGDAGTGKSRLIDEFKTTLDPGEIQWFEGHAYAYSHNVPYFPLIDLLNSIFRIEDGDSPLMVKQKLESAIEHLVGKKEEIAPYLGRLYSLSYREADDVSPEFWKSRFQETTQTIIAALAQKAPTVFFLEDLHWADPSFVELLRHTLLRVRQPAMVLCTYRPTFSLFTGDQLSSIGKVYQEMRLQDLSLSEAQDMLESLLRTETVPSDLKRFVHDKAEGNPFYLEELINSLIESETLVRDDGSWKITRPIIESEVSTTIHGVVSGRLDRLEKESKRAIQEASVIGRAFLYEILKRITKLKDQIDRCLNDLERLDLIRTRSLQPDLEYMFKHALTQEVVYSGLLMGERRAIHERIGLVMEEFFCDRLTEFSETLAFHFAHGQSVRKAVGYLMKSGEKSLGRYALGEAHQYYKDAFEILPHETDRSREDDRVLIDLLIQWAYVFYYRGDFKVLTDLLRTHEGVAESLNDKARLGMFYGWLGMALWARERFRDSYQYLCKALELGEEIGDQKVIGYACTWLTWTCADLGRLDEAVHFGERAQEIYKLFESDDYFYLKSLGGLGYVHWLRGERKKTLEAGEALVEFGQRHSNIRSMVMGHYIIATSHFMNGDFPSAIECCSTAIRVSSEPYYSQIPRTLLGMSYVQNGEYEDAEKALRQVVAFSEAYGSEAIETPARMGLAVVSIVKGDVSEGFKTLEDIGQKCLNEKNKFRYALSEYVLAKAYFRVMEGVGSTGLRTVAKNLGFLIREAPFVSQKAELHFQKLIEVSKEIGDKGLLGEGYLGLGLVHKEKGRTDKARECLSEAIRIFGECEIDVFRKEATETLASLT